MDSFKFNKDYGEYYKYGKLSNGQSCLIVLSEHKDELEKYKTYTVGFAIANKKKHLRNWVNQESGFSIDSTQTGTAGFEGLIWAYKMLKQFEKEVYSDCNIVVQGADSRRFRIYEHFLKREGYIKTKSKRYGWCMRKEIRHDR